MPSSKMSLMVFSSSSNVWASRKPFTLRRTIPWGSFSFRIWKAGIIRAVLSDEFYQGEFVLDPVFELVPDFVHDLAHQEDSQAFLVAPLDVLLHVGIGDRFGVEDAAGVPDHDLELLVRRFDLDLDGAFRALVVAVLDDVGDGLVDGEDDLVFLLAGEPAGTNQAGNEIAHHDEVLRVVGDDQPVLQTLAHPDARAYSLSNRSTGNATSQW